MHSEQLRLPYSKDRAQGTGYVLRRFNVWGVLRKFLAFSGPGYLVAVGYMDPGNWASDINGGAGYGYNLLSVLLLSNFMAMLLQFLSLKLGIVTGSDLAKCCRDHYSRPTGVVLWLLCEIAIVACDLAEVIGTAIAINLLFGLPLIAGVLITAVDTLLILQLQQKGVRYVEALVIALISTVALCCCYEIVATRPGLTQIAAGLVPTHRIMTDPGMLYAAISIIGATVMPHNLYLHSYLVQARAQETSATGKRRAIRFAFADTTVALTFALLVNGAILIVSAAVFHRHGYQSVSEIQDAFHLLPSLTGLPLAGTVFAIALLAAGKNSTLTGTLAGQVVMEGFLDIRISPSLRRMVTRGLAIIPAAAITILYGNGGLSRLLIFSQVILSLQLPFAVVPLIRFTSNPAHMGKYKNGPWLNALAWAIAVTIIVLNFKLAADFLGLAG